MLSKHKFALALAGLSLAGLTTARLVAAPVAVEGAETPQAGRYKLETSHARVLFSVSHAGLSTWYGEFPGAVGELQLDPSNPARSHLEVSVQTAGVTTTSSILDEELRGAKWFDATRFPTISFRSRTITPTGPHDANVQGDLTMHGITKTVTLHAHFNKAGINPFAKTYTVGFEVSGKIKRSEFGVSEDVPLIGDDVTLIISAPFEKQS
jgi:polyisoprenoid-binding protein YceI